MIVLFFISIVYSQTYDFSGFPPPNVPPPVNPAWNSHYGISSGVGPTVKMPLDTISYPTCPTSRDGCDRSCYTCDRDDDITICPSSKDFGMSFDDGPSESSLLVLDMLKELNVQATFCVLGSQVIQFPDILKRMYMEGHTICAHTWSHRYLTSQTDEQIVAEFEWAIQAIQLVIGVRPILVRPPFGDIDDRVREVFRKMKLTNLVWNRDTYDWKLNNPQLYNFQESFVLNNLSNWITSAASEPQGSIVLAHDLLPISAGLGVTALKMVKDAGLKIVSIEQCLNKDFHEAPKIIPNTTTATNFPAPPPRPKRNNATTIFVVWHLLCFLLLSSIF